MYENLLFLCGPNGIGKTTISKEIVKQLPNTAYVDSDPCRFMNPFVLSDEIIPTIAKNISELIHGRRKEVFQKVLANISKIEHNFIPFLLWCNREENIGRMNADNRSDDRIQQALTESRKAFEDVVYPKLDITSLSASEVAKTIIIEAGLFMLILQMFS